MTTEQILQSLTPLQKNELNKNLRELEETVASNGNVTPDKLGEANVNLRLDNDSLFLNMTVIFILGPNGRLIGHIANLKKFNNTNEYLDSINNARRLKGDWKTLK